MIVVVLMTYQNGFAQDPLLHAPDPVDEVQELLESGDFLKANKLAQEYYALDTANIELCYLLGKSFELLPGGEEKAIRYLNCGVKVKHIPSVLLVAEIYLHAQRLEELKKMLALLDESDILDPRQREEKRKLKDHLEFTERYMRDVRGPAVNLGKVINSEYDDYVPLITAAEDQLIFTSRRPLSTTNKPDASGYYDENVFIAKKSNDSWSSPVPISKNINSALHDAGVYISPEGERLLVYRSGKKGHSGDLLFSENNGTEWSSPASMGESVNTDQYNENHACYSSSMDRIYFSSDRPGGFGGRDIYRSVKLPGGTWSYPQNLGPVINSSEDEDSPFLSLDGKYLYFSSKGHINMGGYDVFVSEKTDDDTWSAPLNMGFPVNSPANDIYLVSSGMQNAVYFSSDRSGGMGRFDIYKASLSAIDPVRDFVTVFIVGEEQDGSTRPLRAKLTLLDESRERIKGIFRTNERTGKGVLLKDNESVYYVVVEAEGYQMEKVQLGVLQNETTIKLKKK